MSHTPGPWICEKQSDDAVFTAIGETIAIIGGEACEERVEFIVGRSCDYGPHGDAQTEANAKLIAAAPEMLSILKRIIAVDDRGDTPSPSLMEEALAVVKKAEP